MNHPNTGYFQDEDQLMNQFGGVQHHITDSRHNDSQESNEIISDNEEEGFPSQGSYPTKIPENEKNIQMRKGTNSNQIESRDSGNMLQDNNEEKEELLTITVELGEGTADIVVYEDDKAEDLAIKFIKEYGLNQNIFEVLTAHIQTNIDQVKDEIMREEEILKEGEDQLQDEEEESPVTAELKERMQKNIEIVNQERKEKVTKTEISSGAEQIQKMLEERKQMEEMMNQLNPDFDRIFTSEKGEENIEFNPNLEEQDRMHPQINPYSGQGNSKIFLNEHFHEITAEPVEKTDSMSPPRNQTSKSMEEFNKWQKEIEKKLKDKVQNLHNPSINEMSKKLVASKNMNSIPVHQRLHQLAVNKQVAERKQKDKSQTGFEGSYFIEKESTSEFPREGIRTKKKIEEKNLNFGHRLYQKGLKKKEERERINKEARKEREKSELNGLTFTPQIISKKAPPRTCSKLEDHLMFQGDLAKKKKDQIRTLYLVKDQQQYSFHPEINRKSQYIAQSRSKNFSCEASQRSNLEEKFDFLFEDAKKRKEKQNKYSQLLTDVECTFKPDIGITQSNINKKDHSFFERLESAKNESSIVRDHLKREYAGDTDNKTGQEYFKPKIGRAPLKQRNTANLAIGDYLYSQKKVLEEQVERKRQEMEQNMKKNVEVPKQTNIMMEKMKTDAYKEIFDKLDSDQDGIISATKIEVSSIPHEILEIYCPLLSELKELNQTLNLEEFIDASNRLYKTLSIPEKAAIVTYPKAETKKKEEKPEFKPVINAYSRKLAEKRRPPGERWEDLVLKEKEKFYERIAEEKKRKDEEEQRQCYFTPQLVHHKGLRPTQLPPYIPSAEMKNPMDKNAYNIVDEDSNVSQYALQQRIFSNY